MDKHDVVHVEHLRGSSYGLALREWPVLLDAVDCISLLFERTIRQGVSLGGRLRAFLDLARTRYAEGRYGATFRQVVVTSPEDAWALRQLQATDAPAPSISVIPNGVDMEMFTPVAATERPRSTLLLSGKMSYHANEAAALYLGREIMPLIWRERPDVECVIAGRDPTPSIVALGSDARIRVTGAVDSMAKMLHQSTIAVVPLRYGVGIQNKVLEAMATATPVVATPQATQALAPEARAALLQANSPSAFAQAVLELLEQPQRRQQLGEAGRTYVETHHSWLNNANRLVERYAQA